MKSETRTYEDVGYNEEDDVESEELSPTESWCRPGVFFFGPGDGVRYILSPSSV